MLEAEGGLKQDVFFCLRADGPINVEGGGEVYGNQIFP